MSNALPLSTSGFSHSCSARIADQLGFAVDPAAASAAQKRVRELNNRFADWYYVVSNKEYAKIHLTRDAIAQKKEAEPKEPQPPT